MNTLLRSICLDLLSGSLVKTILAHAKTVTSLALTNNNSHLISASLDGFLKFHNLSTYTLDFTFFVIRLKLFVTIIDNRNSKADDAIVII